MIGRNEITAMINTVFDAVNASKAGPVTRTNEHGELELSSLGYNTFLYVISKLIPTEVGMSANFTEEKSTGETSKIVMGNARIS